jgi:hypothetical protein
MDKLLLKEILVSPIYQGWIVGCMALICMLIIHYKGTEAIINTGVFWMFVYVALNIGMAFIQPRIWGYFIRSTGVFLLLMILIPMCIFVIASIAKSRGTMNTMKIFWAPAIAYPVLLLAVTLIRWFLLRIV